MVGHLFAPGVRGEGEGVRKEGHSLSSLLSSPRTPDPSPLRLVQFPPTTYSHRPRREDSPSMPKVTFVNEKQEIEVPQGSNLRTEARKAGIAVHGMALSLLN